MKEYINTTTLYIWTDGSCLRNPGPGGWAAILRYKDVEKAISGGNPDTTNNQMELTAVIKALQLLKKTSNIDITTDSQYVINGITKWIYGWKKKNWKNVKNIELWKELDTEVAKHTIKWNWIKGHTGHAENEKCDDLARSEAQKFNN